MPSLNSRTGSTGELVLGSDWTTSLTGDCAERAGEAVTLSGSGEACEREVKKRLGCEERERVIYGRVGSERLYRR